MNLSHKETVPSTRGCRLNPGSCTHRPRAIFLNLALVLSPALTDPLLTHATPALAPDMRANTAPCVFPTLRIRVGTQDIRCTHHAEEEETLDASHCAQNCMAGQRAGISYVGPGSL